MSSGQPGSESGACVHRGDSGTWEVCLLLVELSGTAGRESRTTHFSRCQTVSFPCDRLRQRRTGKPPRYRLTRDNRRRPKRDDRRRSVLIVPFVGGEPRSEGATVGKGDIGRNGLLNGKKERNLEFTNFRNRPSMDSTEGSNRSGFCVLHTRPPH